MKTDHQKSANLHTTQYCTRYCTRRFTCGSWGILQSIF